MEHYDWNEGWLFTPRFDPALVRPECGLELEPVRIPHTMRVLPYNYCSENEYQCLCGYRREFFAPREWEGRTVLLTFGAVAHDATVFCNGRRLFHHGCGYTAFTVDLTGALHFGQKNVVAVRCDSREGLADTEVCKQCVYPVSPTVTPGSRIAPAPIQTLRPMVTGARL